MQTVFLIVSFLIIAVIYSMVGLGGGTAYTAVMVLTGISKTSIPVIALTCNLLVAGQGFYRFRKAGFFNWHLFWPFAVTSIPAAYFGGNLHLSDKSFGIIMATALILAAFRLVFWRHPPDGMNAVKGNYLPKMCLGLLLGFLAGITGIGGGVYLIPVLLLFRWSSVKEASAVSALFILVNSLSGLAGQLSKGGFHDWRLLSPLLLVVIIGGFFGSRAGAVRFKANSLQKIVGVILLLAALRLIMGSL